MNICNEIQLKLSEINTDGVLKNKNDQTHLKSCLSCQNYLQACHEMNETLTEMSGFDADDALVESTLTTILNLQSESKAPHRQLYNQWASGLAACFVVVSMIALFPYNSVSHFDLFAPEGSAQMVSVEEKSAIKKRKDAIARKSKEKNNPRADFQFIEVDIQHDTVNIRKRSILKKTPPPAPKLSLDQSQEVLSQGLGLASSSIEPLSELMDGIVSQNKKNMTQLGKAINQRNKGEYLDSLSQDQDSLDDTKDIRNDISLGARINVRDHETVNPVLVTGSRNKRESSKSDETQESLALIAEEQEQDDRVQLGPNTVTGSRILHSNSLVDKRQQQQDPVQIEQQDGDLVAVTDGFLIPKKPNSILNNYKGLFAKRIKHKREENSPVKKPLSDAKIYLQEKQSFQGLTYQSASGYWSNNYLPGDASMRWLADSLNQQSSLTINTVVQQNRQPFDLPSTSALAVYLSSDHAKIENNTPTRMRLQVGIQASKHKSGHRSAMNIGLVIDLSNYDQENAERLKSLLLALLKAKQPSDKISLTVTGQGGGTLIPSSDFRHGTIQVALSALFNSKHSLEVENISLQQAVDLASQHVQQNDDPNASLGLSVMLLISDQFITNPTAIEASIHNYALKGISLSTLSLNNSSNNNQQQLNKLALAGQGHARILANAADAKRVIEAELLASSRAVARALRLRIRLGKGVRLIKVLDSYNLNKKQAQRVRDAEQSLDQRLSKNLGIQADRGKDEEGIQIVIPAFFAGDTHVVLLDVVASNPGAIADVSIRYKDLLYLRNSISRKQLNLTNEHRTIGPLQLNVIKNALASRFAKQMKQASKQINQNEINLALMTLNDMKDLYRSMRLEFPIWDSDREILIDESLLKNYIVMLESITGSDEKKTNYIVDSLRYVSWRKNITHAK